MDKRYRTASSFRAATIQPYYTGINYMSYHIIPAYHTIIPTYHTMVDHQVYPFTPLFKHLTYAVN